MYTEPMNPICTMKDQIFCFYVIILNLQLRLGLIWQDKALTSNPTSSKAQCWTTYQPQGQLKESLFVHFFLSFSGGPSFDIRVPGDSDLYANDIKV